MNHVCRFFLPLIKREAGCGINFPLINRHFSRTEISYKLMLSR